MWLHCFELDFCEIYDESYNFQFWNLFRSICTIILHFSSVTMIFGFVLCKYTLKFWCKFLSGSPDFDVRMQFDNLKVLVIQNKWPTRKTELLLEFYAFWLAYTRNMANALDSRIIIQCFLFPSCVIENLCQYWNT